jgi:serine/threonine-protein kinase
MIGKTLSHYRLVEKIGEGGMGVVYRAHDTRLERDVALKVLPAGVLSDDAARKRFRKEALALSKLNHPNIATVFDFDTEDGTDFLVMEYIPGTTLNQKVAAGPMTEKEIARLGRQIAEGLAAAHDQSVLHRDLKPANIRITTDGRAKILDFGLAKLIPPPDMESRAETATESAALAGTLPYMAPEQLRRERLDTRTDIFAFGDVLYEMATGRRPFRGETQPQLTEAILHEAPVAPRALNSRLSPDLERIITKCLEKEPERRYQSAKEVEVDLRRLGASGEVVVPAPNPPRPRRWLHVAIGVAVIGLAAILTTRLLNIPGPPSPEPEDGKVMLAVLPFENLSADPEQEYFSDGMTEEMIAHLGRLQPEQLGVIARTSAMQYKNTTKQVDQIGRELGVQYLLEGSVRRAAGRVRITAQLIQVSDQTHLWADTFDSDSADVLALQSQVAQFIAREINIKLTPEEQAHFGGFLPVDPEAFEAYLRGRYFWNKRTPGSMKKGIEYFQQAIEKDPNHPLAYAGLADSYNMLGNWSVLPPKEAYPEAKAAARKALGIDGKFAEAQVALSYATFLYDWEWEEAEKGFERALELNPNYAPGHQWYAVYLIAWGRHNEARAEIERAHDLDPLSLIISSVRGWIFFMAREYDQTIEQCREIIELDPGFFAAHFFLARAYGQKGMYEEAIVAFQKAVSLSGGNISLMGNLGRVYALAGEKDEATRVLRELMDLSKQQYVSPFDIAKVHTGLGEWDQAFVWLEKALEERHPWLVHLAVDPTLDSLRPDPRFQDLLRRLGLPTD